MRRPSIYYVPDRETWNLDEREPDGLERPIPEDLVMSMIDENGRLINFVRGPRRFLASNILGQRWDYNVLLSRPRLHPFLGEEIIIGLAQLAALCAAAFLAARAGSWVADVLLRLVR